MACIHNNDIDNLCNVLHEETICPVLWPLTEEQSKKPICHLWEKRLSFLKTFLTFKQTFILVFVQFLHVRSLFKLSIWNSVMTQCISWRQENKNLGAGEREALMALCCCCWFCDRTIIAVLGILRSEDFLAV